MKYSIDRHIRLDAETELKSLYSWSLHECAPDGTAIDRKQVPWHWSVYFSASEVNVSNSIHIEQLATREVGLEAKSTVVASNRIAAVLQPGLRTDGQTVDRHVAFSMFGTDRVVQAITMRVSPLEDASTRERCELWGCVSYTSEVDFRELKVADTLQINVWLLPERFYDLRAAIDNRQLNALQIRLSQVDGFYSEWSPSVTTDRIKLLAAGGEQEVATMNGCDASPPRLGHVGDFELTVATRNAIDFSQGLRGEDAERVVRSHEMTGSSSSKDIAQSETLDILKAIHLAW